MQRIIFIILGVCLIGLYIAKTKLHNANEAIPLTNEYILASRLFYAVMILTGLYGIYINLKKLKK